MVIRRAALLPEAAVGLKPGGHYKGHQSIKVPGQESKILATHYCRLPVSPELRPLLASSALDGFDSFADRYATSEIRPQTKSCIAFGRNLIAELLLIGIAAAQCGSTIRGH